MNYEELNKDEKIISTIKHLIDKFEIGNFKIKDYWDGDLCAIGLTDNEEKYLIYFSTYGDNGFFVSLENLKLEGDLDFPYEPAGDFNNVNLEDLEKIFIRHLRL
ncbi:hypothetical protein MYP_3166 [Sporocytophaga myxococcoides]|uniref:Uncharacterized protein n=1 Tax=Sporocytophaga myxococcoides TaxID=153721 RepID=A0A098LHN9_9BACT|nr:hypothetical protein [Sporocytophaga myxococcoides]GAL85937.1 hypothetical protein MYP_3166 [Sporocytophaga myxococcoides]